MFEKGLNDVFESKAAPVSPPPERKPRMSLVQVFFPDRNTTLSYFNDSFDLHIGDIVFVDGKLEDMPGKVVEVNYNFKIKLSDYKKVIAKADTSVNGEFQFASSHLISFDRSALPFEKALTWYVPNGVGDYLVCGNSENEADDKSFKIDGEDPLPFSAEIMERGFDYYRTNKVVYLELCESKVRAIVKGTKVYTVECRFTDGKISNMTCDCFCTYNCKHEFAVILQLKELLDKLDPDNTDYFAAVSSTEFMRYVLGGNDSGTISVCTR